MSVSNNSVGPARYPGRTTAPGKDGAPLEGDASAGAQVVKGPDGKPVVIENEIAPLVPPGTPGAPGATVKGAKVAPKTLVNLYDDDSVGSSESGGESHRFDAMPMLPPGESKVDGKTARYFQAFTNGISEIVDNVRAPGAWKEIQERAAFLQENPDQSFLLSFAALPMTQTLLPKVTESAGSFLSGAVDGAKDTVDQLFGDDESNTLKGLLDQGQQALKSQDPKQIAAFIEACADFMIVLCAQLNAVDQSKTKDLLGALVNAMQKFEDAKQHDIDHNATQNSNAVEANKRAQEAAKRMAVWNALLVVVLIIVAIVATVCSIFTAGQSLWATAACIAGIVACVCMIIQSLPIILEGFGIECDWLKDLLKGPFGTVLQVIGYIALAVMVICSFGALAAPAAGASASATAVSNAAGEAAAQAATQAAIQGAEQGLTGAALETFVQEAAHTAAQAAAEAAAQAATEAVSQAVVDAAVDAATTSAVDSALNGATLAATTTAAQTAAQSATFAAEHATALTLRTACNVAQGLLSAAKAGVNMQEARLEEESALLTAQVQQLEVELQELLAEIQKNKVYKDQTQEAIKALMEQMTQMMQKFIEALNSYGEGYSAILQDGAK